MGMECREVENSDLSRQGRVERAVRDFEMKGDLKPEDHPLCPGHSLKTSLLQTWGDVGSQRLLGS